MSKRRGDGRKQWVTVVNYTGAGEPPAGPEMCARRTARLGLDSPEGWRSRRAQECRARACSRAWRAPSRAARTRASQRPRRWSSCSQRVRVLYFSKRTVLEHEEEEEDEDEQCRKETGSTLGALEVLIEVARHAAHVVFDQIHQVRLLHHVQVPVRDHVLQQVREHFPTDVDPGAMKFSK